MLPAVEALYSRATLPERAGYSPVWWRVAREKIDWLNEVAKSALRRVYVDATEVAPRVLPKTCFRN